MRARAGPGDEALVLLGGAALAATGAAVYTSAVSRHAPQPASHAVVTVVVCLSFVCAGIFALRQPPYVRFGWLLSAVGFSSLLGALHDANHAVPYTIGVFTANLVFAVLVHAMLAFPHGHLATFRSRLVVITAYVNVLLLQGIAVLFDPLTRWHSDHPRNAALVDSQSTLSTVLEEIEAAIAIAIVIAVIFSLSRRVAAATPAARRNLTPVLLGGEIGLLFFAVGLVLAPISSDAAVIGIGIGLIASLAFPAGFLTVLLQGRLSRAAVGQLLLELGEPGDPPGLEDALGRALGDPTLALARVEGGVYVDSRGKPVTLPGSGATQVSTLILHHGEPIGALIHDRTLRLRPELLDAVCAAAGFALANERALETVQRIEQRSRALLDAMPDPMIVVSHDGTYLEVRAHDQVGLLASPRNLVGRNIREVLEGELVDHVLESVERTLETGSLNAIEYEIEIDGDMRVKESRMVPSGPDEVLTIVRDFTEQRRAEAEERRLAAEQAALRRVATLVAGDARPEQVFQSVTEEVCRLLGLRTAVLHRFGDDDSTTVVGKFGEPTGALELGSTLELEEGTALWVRDTGAAARSNYDELPGPGAAQLRELGYRSAVGVPINVGGVTWGALVAALREGETIPVETERRLEGFAELVALAVASAQARDELAASRLRIIEASDAERRRLERNLHDGAQQRLVALSVGLGLARRRVRECPEEAEELLSLAANELAAALTELRELAQGIHPAVLTERGLETALEVLAARTPIPVELDVNVPERLPEPVEAAAYYVASEALANVVKHAHAQAAGVRVDHGNGHAVIEVEDDGIGGASLDGGSGLCGLRDRVETLNGRLHVASLPGVGTVVRAELPVHERGLTLAGGA
ncbi:MAG TPA: histidine kinase [Gaiellaceae bacterium]